MKVQYPASPTWHCQGDPRCRTYQAFAEGSSRHYRAPVDESESGQAEQPEPAWTVTFEGEDEQASPRSLLVEVQMTHRLEVTDLAALQAAVEVLDGPPQDEMDRRLRQVPANLVGSLFRGPLPLPDLPGVVRRSSGLIAGECQGP